MLTDEHIIAFKEEMQEAFQHGFEAYNRDDEETNQWNLYPRSIEDSKKYMSNVINGKQGVSINILQQIASVLDVPVSSLFAD